MNLTQNEKIRQVKEDTLIIGVDIASEVHYARAFDWRGIELGCVFSFENSEEGFESFLRWINELKDSIQKLEQAKEERQNKGYDTKVEDLEIPREKSQLEKLQSSIQGVTDAQAEYDKQKELSNALDYKSAQNSVQDIANSFKEVGAKKQLAEQYQAVYDKLKAGIALSDQEQELNKQLIDQYPQYTRVLNDKTNAIGIDISALKDNITAEQALATVQLDSLKQTAISSKAKTDAIISDTQKRIIAYGDEIQALQALNDTYATDIDYAAQHGGKLPNGYTLTDAEEATYEHNYQRNSGQIHTAANTIVNLNKKLEEEKTTSAAWETLMNLSPEDIMRGASGSSGYTSTGSKSSSTKTVQQPSWADPTDARIRAYNATNLLTKAQNDNIKTTIEADKAQNNYNKALKDTQSLIAGQATEITQLKQANANIGSEFSRVVKAYGMDVSKWLDSTGEATNAYYEQFNTASVDTQARMEQELGTLQKLLKAQLDNVSTINDLTNSTNDLNSSLVELQNSLYQFNYDKMTSQYSTVVDKFKSTLDALDFTKTLVGDTDYDNLTKIIQQKMATTLEEISAISDKIKSINSMNISNDQKQDLFNSWSKDLEDAISSYKSLEKEMQTTNSDMVNNALDAIKTVQDKLVDMIKQGLQDQLDAEQKRHDKVIDDYNAEKDAFDKNIQDQINAIDKQNNEDSYNKELNQAQKERNDLQAQIDALMLDNSEAAKAQRYALQQQLDSKDQEIQDKIAQHGTDVRKQNLQDQQQAYDDEKDSEIDAENKAFDEYKDLMDQRMKTDQLYAAAREKLTTETLDDITNEYIKFEDKFGDGMSLLGDKIKNDFIANLVTAKENISDLSKLIDSISSASGGSNTVPTGTEGNPVLEEGLGTLQNTHIANKPTVYGAKVDVDNAVAAFGIDRFNYAYDTNPDPNKINAGDIIVSGPGVMQDYGDLRNKGALFLYGDTAAETKAMIQQWAKMKGYKEGGPITETGVALVHGSPVEPEYAMSNPDVRNVSDFMDYLKTSKLNPLPLVSMPAIASVGGGAMQINTTFNIEGSLDKDVVPKIEQTLIKVQKDIKDMKYNNPLKQLKNGLQMRGINGNRGR